MSVGRAAIGATALLVALGGCGAGDDTDGAAATGSTVTVTPPGTDVWVADLHWEAGGLPTPADPVNLTQRAGYDNQPMFTPDGSGLWYTVIDDHTGQADIWRHDLETGAISPAISSNPESEYSATPLPDGSGISVIRVEADSTQRLWRFDPDGMNGAPVIEDLAPIGYHAWADETTVVVFVLGDPPTLQRVDTSTGSVEVLARDIGRSIQSIPESNDVSFVQRHEDGTATIMGLRTGSSEPEPIIEAVDGGDFHAWAPGGMLMMASGSVVYARGPEDDAWTAVADYSRLRLEITRLAVRPDGAQIALVGEVDLQG